MNWILTLLLALAASYGSWQIITMDWAQSIIQSIFLWPNVGVIFGIIALAITCYAPWRIGRFLVGTVCHGKEGVVSLLYFLLFSVYYAWSIAPTGEGPFWYKAILWLIIAGEAIIQIRMVFIGFKAQRALCD